MLETDLRSDVCRRLPVTSGKLAQINQYINVAKFCDILHYRVNVIFLYITYFEDISMVLSSLMMVMMVMMEISRFVFVPRTMPIKSSSRRSNGAPLSKS